VRHIAPARGEMMARSLYISNTDTFDLWSAARRQRRVLHALMLRNIRTKFFGNGLGMLVGIAWPLSHILILVTLYTLAGRAPPYGDSIALFVATGVVPFQVFNYFARFMMIAVIRSRPLLAFPEVKVLDILFASATLEFLSTCCVVLAFLVLAWLAGIDAIPINIVQASYALGASVLLGLGFGVLNGVIALAMPTWVTGYVLTTIVLWFTAGIFFVPDALPATIREYLAYHPVLQVIEWMRSAYYEGYGDLMLDRTYAVCFSLGSLFLGLLLERALRGHVLSLR